MNDTRLAIALMSFFGFGVLIGAVSLWIRNTAAKGIPMSFKIELGAKVTDKITGYTGLVIARTEWLYSCKRYVVQAREMKDGKPVESINCDEDQLDIVEDVAEKHVMRNTGGPAPKVTRGNETRR